MGYIAKYLHYFFGNFLFLNHKLHYNLTISYLNLLDVGVFTVILSGKYPHHHSTNIYNPITNMVKPLTISYLSHALALCVEIGPVTNSGSDIFDVKSVDLEQ